MNFWPMNPFRIFPAAAVFALLISSCSNMYSGPFEEDLNRLDDVISRADEYVHIKEQKISTIENMLHSRGVSPLQQYHIYGELYKEYEAFQFDKAKDALDSQIRLAEEIGDRPLKDDATISKAYILTTAGYFHEAELVFNQIDTTSLSPEQMTEWYRARLKFLYDYNEYVSGSGFVVEDYDKISYYDEKIISSLPEDSYERKNVEIIALIGERKFKEASALNMNLLKTIDANSRDYAIQTYWQGRICDGQGDKIKAIHWWVESAICDIKAAIKDNASLSSVALEINDFNDVDRAFRYIRFSFDDAAFYNAKLRKVQIATSFPLIEKAYTDSRMRQEKERRIFIFYISSIALLLAFFCALAFRMYLRDRKSSVAIKKKNDQLTQYNQSIMKAEEILRKTNLELIEANAAKEEYLGLFLSMCSGYLDKLKKTLTRDQYDAELKNFYKTFDTSFLQLYPSFVEEFNALLKEDGRITLKDGELLNTELRIFALIKLGITQSSHIASLLRYSVNTIYNYRAQVKNSVLTDRDNFEDLVKTIGSKH